MENVTECKIIPIPKHYSSLSGEIVSKMRIITKNIEWEKLCDAFCESMNKVMGIEMAHGKGGIEIEFDEKVVKEGYEIIINDKVLIKASDIHGAAYALSSIMQLAKLKEGRLCFNKCVITDKPDKDYRGLMIDLARKWHPFSSLLKYVDICWFYKIKYLHLHFIDDQGYTLPSKAFPKLSELSRCYSFEEIERLCKYAKARGVELIPEIEMPGHIKILNMAYPEIFADCSEEGQERSIITESGVTMDASSVICPGSEKAFAGIKSLIDEVCEMFDCRYIHLGGDEVNTKAWESCSVCKEYMKNNNISDVEELYCDFTGRITDYALSKGVTPIIWEGFKRKYSKMISKDVIVIGWECHYQNPDELFEDGYKIINCSWQPLYVVPSLIQRWGIREILSWNVYEWQHWWEKSAATLNPIHLPESDRVLGGQLCVWEQTFEREVGFAAENIAALSERVWAVKRIRTFEEFSDAYIIQSDKLFKLIS